jgi:ABC-2 type transport system ATP-binding protein
MSINTIETHQLSKNYGKITALDGLSLNIDRGEVFGLLGPNGAGKTTAISILCTIVSPTAGTATVNGFNILKQPDKVRRSIGIVFQDPSIDDRLTGRENMQLHATLYDIPSVKSRKRIDELLNLVSLNDRADAPMKTYSGGMKRRLELARGLLHRPQVLFLDEPTLGLDPQTREHLWTYISDLVKKEEITVILTTHYMEEAERLCSRVGIIDFGRIKVIDSPDSLKASLTGDVVTILTEQMDEFTDRLQDLNIASNVEKRDGYIRFSVKDADQQIPQLVEIASSLNISIKSISVHKPTLNDVFLHYTGREMRPEDAENNLVTHMRTWSRMR